MFKLDTKYVDHWTRLWNDAKKHSEVLLECTGKRVLIVGKGPSVEFVQKRHFDLFDIVVELNDVANYVPPCPVERWATQFDRTAVPVVLKPIDKIIVTPASSDLYKNVAKMIVEQRFIIEFGIRPLPSIAMILVIVVAQAPAFVQLCSFDSFVGNNNWATNYKSITPVYRHPRYHHHRSVMLSSLLGYTDINFLYPQANGVDVILSLDQIRKIEQLDLTQLGYTCKGYKLPVDIPEAKPVIIPPREHLRHLQDLRPHRIATKAVKR